MSRLSAAGTIGLSACVVGLILSPYAYIAVGALSHFGLGFSLVAVPMLILSTGYLVFRLLSKPSERERTLAPLLLELCSWLVVLAFLVIVSKFTLFTTFERIGAIATLFLACSVLALGVVLVRTSALQQRLERAVPRASIVLLAVLLIAVSAVAVAYWLAPPQFI